MNKDSRTQASLKYMTNPVWAPILQEQDLTKALVGKIQLFFEALNCYS